MLLGPPDLMLVEAGQKRASRLGELWWRLRGRSEWQLDVRRAGPGLCEFAWRDGSTRHIRDKLDAVVLPLQFLIARQRSGHELILAVQGWSGTAELDGGDRLHAASWRVSLQAGSPWTRCLRLCGDGCEPLRLTLSLPHQAWIYEWSGSAVPNGQRLSLSTLNRYVARSTSGCTLSAELLDRAGRRVPEAFAHWRVGDELPLAAIRDDLASMLRPHGDIDARLVLRFSDSDANRWFAGEFDLELRNVGCRWEPDRTVLDEDASVAGRPTHDPAEEREFGRYGLLSDLNHRPIDLPPLKGDWLIYLRSGDRVLSRPRYLCGTEPLAYAASALAAAMSINYRTERQAALLLLIDEALRTPASEASYALFRSMIRLAMSLSGLPPSTFDVLSLLCERPTLGTAML